MNTEERFFEILRKKVGDKEVTRDTDLRSLGFDSLDLVELVLEAEELFHVEFVNEEMNNFQKVSDVLDAIIKKQKK